MPMHGPRPRRVVRLAAAAVACAGAAQWFGSSGFVGAPVPDLLPRSARDISCMQMHVDSSGAIPVPAQGQRGKVGKLRTKINLNRKPVAALVRNQIVNEQGRWAEPGTAILRRLWESYDDVFFKMRGTSLQHHRVPADKRWFESEWRMSQGGRRNKFKLEEQLQKEWTLYMATTGRKKGMQDPIVFKGPPLKHLWTEADSKKLKELKGKAVDSLEIPHVPRKALMPEECQPGKWYEKDDPANIMNIFKRPLHRTPFEIGKKGRMKQKTNGIVS